MKLHRAGSQPDWAGIEPSKQNYWQRLAARTNGIVTPGNFFTILGLVGVMIGLVYIRQGHYFLALLFIVAGRLCDVVDGALAERSGTKSPLGEVLDPTVDKLVTVAALVMLVSSDLISPFAAAVVIVINAAITIIVAVGVRRKAIMHTSRAGKVSMALTSVSLFLYVLARDFHTGSRHAVWLLANTVLVLAVVVGIKVIHGYLVDAFASKKLK